jgi:alkylated DNA nucleotide flippase Atl1
MGCGIFVAISARAAEEMEAEGRMDITPWWRTVKEGGKLNEKYPGGAAAQWKRLEAEGFTVEPGRGKQPPRVADYRKHLMET